VGSWLQKRENKSRKDEPVILQLQEQKRYGRFGGGAKITQAARFQGRSGKSERQKPGETDQKKKGRRERRLARKGKARRKCRGPKQQEKVKKTEHLKIVNKKGKGRR